MATVYLESIDELDDTIQREVEFGGGVGLGDTGPVVRRTQEWLALHGHDVAVDAEFGPVTGRALLRFQERAGLDETGSLDFETWAVLTRAMCAVLRRQPTGAATYRETALMYARRHLDARPREVGGAGRGPWARLYARSHDGRELPWRAGFAHFVLSQAAESTGSPPPARPDDVVPGEPGTTDQDSVEGLLWYVGQLARVTTGCVS